MSKAIDRLRGRAAARRRQYPSDITVLGDSEKVLGAAAIAHPFQNATIANFVVTAKRAVNTIAKSARACAQLSQSRSGQYLSGAPLPLRRLTLANVASITPGVQGLIRDCGRLDLGYAAMCSGSDWAAKPGSGRVDSIDALDQIAAQLIRDATYIADSAAQIAQTGTARAPTTTSLAQKTKKGWISRISGLFTRRR